jgi:hypothetical protein
MSQMIDSDWTSLLNLKYELRSGPMWSPAQFCNDLQNHVDALKGSLKLLRVIS